MNGIEKITDKILADANAYEAGLVSEAEAEAGRISEAAAQRAEDIKSKLLDKAQRDYDDITSRADSSSLLLKRNIMLEAKSSLIDEAFNSAREVFLKLPADEYFNTLSKMLENVINAQLAEENELAAKYGSDEYKPIMEYTLILNANDVKTVGAKLSSYGNKVLKKKQPDRNLILSDKPSDIDGGFILRSGDIETNCSLSKIISQLREQLDLENRVYKALFTGVK